MVTLPGERRHVSSRYKQVFQLAIFHL